ncbi:UNVERIFIED_CONTAM: Subtilisin-like protease SBT3 [Sesamum angustifolium]|uniref:Subtilisin-like protease SBT3 n=1 Tax=Sesamum angustifolium TaxID=2727405 RepID=A0AAW2L6D2_9LAMI
MAHHRCTVNFLVLFLTITAQFTISVSQIETYIVHMDPEALPKPFSSPQSYYSSLLMSISDVANSEASEPIYTYTNAIHGFSVRLSPSELGRIKRARGYLFSIKDSQLQLLTTHSSDFLGLNSMSGAWPASDFGRDVIIGVVDSGIWPESKSFDDEGMNDIPRRWKGGCFGGANFSTSFCNRKLIGVRFFNKGVKAANPKSSVKFMNSARDILGHGTHVSSTAAGNFVHGVSYFGYASGTARGMAPRSRLAIYKVVSGKHEGLYYSDVVAAIDSAISDGVDILSLSIASSGALYEDPVSIATFSATSKGVLVSQGAGNSGPSLNTIRSGAPWVLVAGASTTDREFTGAIILGDGVFITGSSFYTLNSIPAHLPIIYTHACGGQKQHKAIGKIVLCHVDRDQLEDSALVLAEGFEGTGVAAAVIILNQSDLPDDEIGFPAIFVRSANGNVILDYINSTQEPTATLMFLETGHGRKPAPKLAPYSSRGPSQSYPLILKPDVIAPGDSILASWQEETPVSPIITGNIISSFNVESGTSMAAPHVAGVAALLKGAHPDWSPAAIRSAMMTTADVLDNLLNPIQEWGYNQAATPLGIGAGHINPNKALDPGLIYDADRDDYVNFLCALNLTDRHMRAITRSPYSCSNPSIHLNYPSFIAFFSGNGTKTVEFQRTLTNVGSKKSSYLVNLENVQGFKVSVVPEKLVFRHKHQKQGYTLKIEGPRLKQGTVLHGFITWVEIGGHHVVRSPIVVASLMQDTTR